MSRSRISRSLALLALLSLPLGAWTAPPLEAPGSEIDFPVVFTQLPAEASVTRGPGRAGGMLRADYGEGCRIVRRDPDGTVRVLTEGFAGACEPDVSFDGEHILFAGKRAPEELWNVWEMNADGADPRQITRDAGNCRNPAYQATLYTIVSTEPWLQVMFTSDVAGEMNEVGSGPALSLYSCRMDGDGLRRLTVNLSDDLDPFLMSDGRVLCSSWQRMDLARGFAGRLSLFGLNTDGTDYALYSADGDARVRHMGCETPGGLVVFVEADHVGWDGAGRLAAVSLRRPFHSYRSLTATEDGLYHSPSPLADGTILVSRRPADGQGTHAIVRLDPKSGESTPVFDDPEAHDLHARALAPRPRPDGRSSSVAEKYETGKLYCLDAYLAAPEAIPHLAPGTIRAVRVIEGVPLPEARRSEYLPRPELGGLAGPGSTVHGLVPLAGRRLLDVAPVATDGSFQVEVPANVPIQLQTLDEDGLALFRCGWVWAKNREWRGCIGCHEDPELVPENRFVEAVTKEPVMMLSPPESRRTVTFARDVKTIVAAKCASCHDKSSALDLSAERDGSFDRAYTSLLTAAEDTARGGEVLGRYVHPGRARTSPLVWLLFQRNTSRPWDRGFVGQDPPPPCAGAEPLTAEERAVFVEWIDLGVLWDDGF